MKPFTRIASVIFGIIALLHLLRLIYGIGVVIGSFQFPMWISFGGFIATAVLSAGLWKEANKNS